MLYNFTIIYARNLALLSTEMIAEKKMLPVREPCLNSTTTQCEATQKVENVWVSEYNEGCSTTSTAETSVKDNWSSRAQMVNSAISLLSIKKTNYSAYLSYI